MDDMEWLKSAGVLDAMHFTMSSIVELGLHDQDPNQPSERNVYEFAAQCVEKFGSHWDPSAKRFDPSRVHTPIPFEAVTPRPSRRASPRSRQLTADKKAAEEEKEEEEEKTCGEAEDEEPKSSPTQVTVVNWNLGLPNTNPFGFRYFNADDKSPAAQLIRALDATVRDLVDGPGNAADKAIVAKVHKALGGPLAEMTVSGLCAGIEQLTGKNESERVVVEVLKENLKDDWGKQKPSDVFKQARKDNDVFDRFDSQFKDRHFSITALASAEQASKLIDACTSSPPCSRWWGLWVGDIASTRYIKNKADINEMTTRLSGMAMLDGLFAAITSAAITALGLDRVSLAEDLSRVALGVGASPASKAMAMVRALSWLATRFQPTAICLQNFDTKWLEMPDFQEDWRGLTTSYQVFGPDKKGKGRKTQLLVRKDSEFSVDTEATTAASNRLATPAFKEELGTALKDVFPAYAVDTQVLHLSSFVQGGTFVPVVLVAKNVKVMVVGAHANANATDSRAAVVTAELLAAHCGAGLMMGMDASTQVNTTDEAVVKGACTEAAFAKFLQARGLNSCLHSPSSSSSSGKAKDLYSVNKEHSFVQASLASAGRKERHLADWVISSVALSLSGKLINCVGGPSNHDLWDASVGMPRPDFQSDHAILLGQADFEPPKAPAETNGSDKRLAAVERIFNEMDADDNGSVSPAELLAKLEADEEMQTMLKNAGGRGNMYVKEQLDANQDGKITLEDLKGVILGWGLIETIQTDDGKAALKEVFEIIYIDKNDDGKVSSKEWGFYVGKSHEVLRKYFGGASQAEIGKSFRCIDKDGSDSLSWEEFVASCSSR